MRKSNGEEVRRVEAVGVASDAKDPFAIAMVMNTIAIIWAIELLD